jgi:hypothetical protein
VRDPIDAGGVKPLWTWTILSFGALAAFWCQALWVPYWQDDYVFLHVARQARLAGEPWYEVYAPQIKEVFWRPLAIQTYCRFVETVLRADRTAAHLANVLLLVAASSAVGWFAAVLVRRRLPDVDPHRAFALATLLYGLHGSNFLPAVWVAAANSSFGVLFSASALACWVVGSTSGGVRGALALAAMLPCLLAALLSREGAVVTPVLGLLATAWLWPSVRPRPRSWAAGVSAIGLVAAWLLVRERYTIDPGPDSAYRLEIGTNVARNAASLVLFFFNLPREALRMGVVRGSVGVLAWGAACLAIQVAAFALLVRAVWGRFDRKDLLIGAAFFMVGCGPCLLLRWNCYEYYIALGLMAYAVLAVAAVPRPRLATAVLVLAFASSTLATLGNHSLEYPAVIGRAHWAEGQLARLAALRRTRPDLFEPHLCIASESDHRFQALGGTAGLAWRTGIPVEHIQFADPVHARGPVLVVPAEGNVYFRAPALGRSAAAAPR